MTVETKAAKKARQHTVYRLRDGSRVPGVTTILGVMAKPALVPWANKLGLQGIEVGTYVDELALIGTLGHRMIEDHLGGGKVEPTAYPDASADQFDRASNCFLKYLDWEQKNRPRVVLSEESLVSEEHRYGGTVDAVMEIGGVLTLVDFKTAKAIYEDHLYQLAGYGRLLAEAGHRIQAYRILQIGRNSEEGFTERTVSASEIEAYWEVFRAALALYRAKQSVPK